MVQPAINTMNDSNLTLNENQINRYSRNILLNDIGGIGQKKLLSAKVLVVGAGGLGSPILYYLAAAGIGKLGIIDHDQVEISNLQRQIIHSTRDIQRKKTTSAKEKLIALNPDINIKIYNDKLNVNNVKNIIRDYDIVADGSDNFETRFILNDNCFSQKKVLVSGAVQGFEGYISTFKFNNKFSTPCYRCIFPEAPPDDTINNCSTVGVLGSVAGVVGSIQATEIVKEILEIGEGLSGWLMIFDGTSGDFRKIKVPKDPKCIICSV